MDSPSSSFSTFCSSSDIEAGCAPPDDEDDALSYQYRHPPLPSSHSLRSQMPPSWTMARFFFDGLDDDDEPRHFLDVCFLCRKPLATNCDIFMYRGDLPFCSRECREEQIEMEEGKEKNRKKLSFKASSARKLDANTGGSGGGGGGAPSSHPKSHDKVRVRPGGAAVVAAGC